MSETKKADPASTELMAPGTGSLAAPSQGSGISVAQILQAAVSGGVNAENVAVVKELVALQERMDAREAEKAFARAFNALQMEMPPIMAMKPVLNRDKTLRYKFAPYEDIHEQVKPLLLKHGFTVSFTMSIAEGRVTQTCTLMHVDGHSRANSSTVRIGSGPPGSTETQADGAASTYAKRFAFCDALNIVIEKDNDGIPDDAKNLGAPIGPDKITVLREQIADLGGDPCLTMVLKLAGVDRIEQVADAQYPVIMRALEMRRAKKQ